MMAGLLKVGVVGVGVAAFVAGVFESSFRHYQKKYSDDEDLRSGSVVEVAIVDDETKARRGRK